MGFKCFKASHIYGTMFFMDFGYPMVTFDSNGENMSILGEWSVSVLAAAWGITKPGERNAITSGDSLIKRKAAISDIMGQTIKNVKFNPRNSRLTIFFGHRGKDTIRLDVYTNYAQKMSDNDAEMWTLHNPDSIIAFYKRGRFEEEKDSGSTQKFTFAH